MNTERMAAILKRVESRRQRALAREKRRIRRSGITSQVNPKIEPQAPSAKHVPRSIGGCGGCRQKAKNFKSAVQNSSKSLPVSR